MIMNAFPTALSTEWLKFRNASLPRLATIGIVMVPSLVSPLSALSQGDSSALSASNWIDYLDLSAGTVATGGVFGFGLVIVWLFGREFVDGTITGLFGLPVPLEKLALAKMALFILWACVTTLMLAAALVGVGAFLDFGPLDGESWVALARFVTVSVLTAMLTIPFSLVATLSRDYLAPIGAILGVVILTSVLADAGLGGWLPYAAPGLWAATSGFVDPFTICIQLLNVVIVSAVFVGFSTYAWKRLET
ncbi:ABC transporter permease [Sphingomonas flavalba]|uniref:ABC transporter permease n=1 Tax=Sphingomonas flavalba TaxID=2559804 RepID=UPI00109E3476|nr:ABC transporter permease [Sphingomonas flavalba]